MYLIAEGLSANSQEDMISASESYKISFLSISGVPKTPGMEMQQRCTTNIWNIPLIKDY